MINKKLYKEIEDYCKLNQLEVDNTLNEALRSGFTILQYGMGPNSSKPKERVVEVIKEVPVEKIVEVIKEVPVEVIKEIPVDKEVIKEVQVEKNVNINVDGHKINYMDYINQLNVSISELEINKTKLSKKLMDSNNKLGNLTKELSDCKIRLEKCKKEKQSGLDIYGE